MNCNNCTNNNALKEVKIKHVHGNVLRMAIPLTLRTIELVDGEINATDTPFVPSSEHPVKVVFSKGSVSVALDATMKYGNIAYIEEKGKIPVGTYAITVTCNDDNGNPYRFKQNAVLYVADATIEAGIEETIEYEVMTWYLDAAIFLALKGEDGVGIYDIETQSSGEIGGVNTVTFILTDGRTRSFNILNGSGAVDSDLDINSPSPVANSAVTAKFNELSGELADLFGDVDYDTSSKSIRFWDKGKTNVLASLDARPFIKDGMVSNAYISNNTLVITFNTDSGKEAIGVPLTSVFNPNNYYTKTQVDSRIASAVANINLSNYYTKSQVDNKLIGLMAKEDFVYEGSVNLKYGSAPEIVLSHIDGVSMYQEDHSRLFGTSNGHIKGYVGATGSQLFDYGLAPNGLVFLDKTSGLFYRWAGTAWQQVGGSSGGYEPPVGGIPKSDLAQSVQDTLDDVSNKVDKVAGKGLSTEDYTTAEKQKLAGLSNYDDTEIQAEVDAKYEKPSTGIPKTDLASGVQTSLGKADTALQSSDLEGYATTDDVDDAVAALVSSAPQTLDTLKELADALGDDPNFATTMATQLGNKVDKETGKGLSTNDYTTAEKNKLAGLENYDDSALQTAIDGKVDKESGKSLMTDAEHTKLAGIAAGAEVNVQSDWNQTTTTADDYIKNKPTLATVATSGSYNDLQDKPTIPAAYDDTTLSGRVSALENAGFITTETDPTVPAWAKASTKPTYTAQEVGALPNTTTIPTDLGDLTNNAGYTKNTGTITGITMNGASKGTSGVVDLGTVITAHQDISGKANASDVYTKTQANTLLAGKLSKSDVSVETQGDGTVDINVKDDTYTINLNHTHQHMAKLEIVDEEPSNPALDTIYAQVDDAEDPSAIESLWIAGLEFVGGGSSAGTPDLSYPRVNNLRLMDDGNDNIVGTIKVKANRYVTDGLDVSISGTDYSITAIDGTALQTPITSLNSPLQINNTDAKLGVTLTIKYSGSTVDAEGTLVVASVASTAEFNSASVDLDWSDVPDGYTRLDYVDNAAQGFLTNVPSVTNVSNGNGGYTFVSGSRWEIDIEMAATPSSTQIIICSTQDVGHWFGALTNGHFGIGTASGLYFSDAVTVRQKFEVEFVNCGIEATLNGTTIERYSSTNYNHWSERTNVGIPFKVSLLNDKNTSNVNLVYKGKIYSIKCVSGGSFNAVPALNTTTNKKGLYDKANNVFYQLES